MIKVKRILGIIELAIYSAYIKGEQPVSVLITAPPESGKTNMVLKFSHNKGCLELDDATAYGIIKHYGEKICLRKIRHLIIPDLVKPMSRQKETVHGLIAFFNSLIEEGIVRTATYAEHLEITLSDDEEKKTDCDDDTEEKQDDCENTNDGDDDPDDERQAIAVKCGLIATLAKEMMLDGRHHWTRMGFMSRMIVVSYDYDISTQAQIHDAIADRQYLTDEKITLNLPEEDVEIKLNKREAMEISKLAIQLVALDKSEENTEKAYGFRLQKNLQRLAMANALKHDRRTVNQEDIERLRKLSRFMNLNYYPI